MGRIPIASKVPKPDYPDSLPIDKKIFDAFLAGGKNTKTGYRYHVLGHYMEAWEQAKHSQIYFPQEFCQQNEPRPISRPDWPKLDDEPSSKRQLIERKVITAQQLAEANSEVNIPLFELNPSKRQKVGHPAAHEHQQDAQAHGAQSSQYTQPNQPTGTNEYQTRSAAVATPQLPKEPEVRVTTRSNPHRAPDTSVLVYSIPQNEQYKNAIVGGQWSRTTKINPIQPRRPETVQFVLLQRRLRYVKPAVQLSVQEAHNLKSIQDGVTFYKEAQITDPDYSDSRLLFVLDQKFEGDALHGACFNIGTTPDNVPIISWSIILAIYSLGDGTKWAVHKDLFDADDLAKYGKKTGAQRSPLLNKKPGHQELYLKNCYHHSRLANIEGDCWIFKDQLPQPDKLLVHPNDAFFYAHAFHPETLQEVELDV